MSIHKIEDMETRISKVEYEIREVESSQSMIVGYAAVFNDWTDIGGWFRESISPGAFKGSIEVDDIRALWNHNTDFVLGRNKANTLKLYEDSKGLVVEILPPEAQWAKDLMVSMKRGDITQMSFGFIPIKTLEDYEKDERILIDVKLFDVSIVTFPAYEKTSASVRSMFESNREKRMQNKKIELVEDVENIPVHGRKWQMKLSSYKYSNKS